VTAVPVDDPGDPRLSEYRDLTDGELRTATESEHGLFIAEGVVVLRRLLGTGLRIRSVLLSPHQCELLAGELRALPAPVYVAPPEVLRTLTGFSVHRGVLAAVDRPAGRSAGELLGTSERVVVLEGVNDHENLGSIFRNVSALGFDAVLLDARCSDPWYRRCVRVSTGHVLTVPSARLDTLEDVRRAGFTLLALTPDVDAAPLGEVARRVRPPLAVLLGAEGPGLSAEARTVAHERVRIPMTPGTDSLNVAAASAIALYMLGPYDIRLA
jgi:tRNA G18 (ribose-2'-O)-methylase SpoU